MSASHASPRVLVVDDSALFRKLIGSALRSLPGVEVVGEAADGSEALELVSALKPDVMTLDVEMPVLDGLGVLQQLRERSIDLRVIMVSTMTHAGTETTVRALCLGASDFLLKPKANSQSEALEYLRAEFGRKLAALCPAPAAVSTQPRCAVRPSKTPEILGIGVSTGGPKALHTLFRDLPSDFPLPILVAQHMPAGFTDSLARSLDEASSIKVSEARSGMRLEPGVALIAPGGHHLEVASGSENVFARVTESPPELCCRPSANVLLRSLAKHYGPATMGLIMTGIGEDGLDGCRTIVDRGGTVFAQDESSSTVFGMPKCVIDAGLVHRVCSLEGLGWTLSELMKEYHATS